MQIRLSYYNLSSCKVIKHGMKVCSSGGSKSVGVITDIGPIEKTNWWTGPTNVTVLWVTGSKKGKCQTLNPSSLAAFDEFRNRIREYVDNLDKLAEEAESFGK